MLKGGVISQCRLSLARLHGATPPSIALTRADAVPPRPRRFALSLACAVDVVNADEARLAEAAGACAVMVRPPVLCLALAAPPLYATNPNRVPPRRPSSGSLPTSGGTGVSRG